MNETTTAGTARAGLPCWYELGTTDLDGAARFYETVLDWQVQESGVEGFDYRIASSGGGNGVAGLMALGEQEGNPPPNWIFYLEVEDCDAAGQAVTAGGGTLLKEPADIPGTGRFAVCADPQGAVFGILHPLPMENPPTTRAFEPERAGHGCWHELTASDPSAAMDFYAKVLGWNAGESMDMGDDGPYQLADIAGQRAVGIMNLLGMPAPAWLPYFNVVDIDATAARVTGEGGTVHHGPTEVPGGGYVIIATDPQGARFGASGPKSA